MNKRVPPKLTFKGKVRIATDDFKRFIKYNIWWPIKRPFDKTIDFVRYRTYDKYHTVVTDLKPGYYDKDTLLFHANFSILADFVEVECAYMNMCWDESKRKKLSHKLYFIFPSPIDKLFKIRSREQGLEFLNWHADHTLTLKERENMGLEDPLKYADYINGYTANWKELREVYLWWRDVYPNRPDPMDKSGWSAWCDKKRDKGEDIFNSEPCAWDEDGVPTMYEMLDEKTPQDQVESRRILDDTHAIEAAYEKEDTEMLIRLIKARHNLWT